MKYIVRAKESQDWTIWYEVEADSENEAIENYLNNGEIIDEIYNGLEDSEAISVEPFNNEN